METLSSKCEKLQSHFQEINNEEQKVGTKSDQSGSVLLARPEFSMAKFDHYKSFKYVLLSILFQHSIFLPVG